ncbi:MAG: glycosyl hydrolase, partial [Casimicrobiaceae bacterium]
RAAEYRPDVAAWLMSPAPKSTEALPGPLQSRWIDAVDLPSRALDPSDIEAAVAAEVQSFQAIFRERPRVVVPPTFVWTPVVEAAWARAGVECVVTPGRRYESRDAHGSPVAVGAPIRNGDRGPEGVTYLVRDDYFEPVRGHAAQRGLDALAKKTMLGRPTLLETHRANFVGTDADPERSLLEIDTLLRRSLEHFPGLAFMSSEELARRLRDRDGDLVDTSMSRRLHVALRRLAEISRLRKLAIVTGAILVAWLLYALTWRGAGSSR